MQEDCLDPLDQAGNTRLALSGGYPSVNTKGEFTLRQVDIFADNLIAQIEQDSIKAPLERLVNRYGQDDFTDALNATGVFFNTNTVDSNEYPILDNRINRGPITAFELSDFLNEYNYTPADYTDKCNRNDSNLFFQFDSYYGESFANSVLGGFCNSLDNIFAALDAFFDVLGEIGKIITDALEFLSKIRNLEDFLKSAIEKLTVKALIEKIKEKLIEQVTKAFDKVAQQIENFNIEGIIGNIDTFLHENIVKKIMTTREEMCLFFNDENKDTLKKKVKDLIDYVVGLFENPGLEEILLMIKRFCGFASQIEALLNAIKQPLSTYSNKYFIISQRLKIISNMNTAGAVEAGAVRFSDEKRKEEINRIEEEWENPSSKAYTPNKEEPYNIKRPTMAEYAKLPKCKDVKEGSDPRVKITGSFIDDKLCGLEGWVKLDLDLKVFLMRFQASLPDGEEQLNVTNGFRSKQYNDEIGGSKESTMMSGLAVEIENLYSVSDEQEIIDLALKAGFKTVKPLSGTIYLDLIKRPTSNQ